MKSKQTPHFKQLELERIQTAMSLQRLASNETADPIQKQQKQRLSTKLERIENALTRLASGNEYGACQSCKQPINAERLAVMPYAELCITCQRNLEKQTFPGARRYQYNYS